MSTTVGTIQYLVEIDTQTARGSLKQLDKSVSDASDKAVSGTDKGSAGFLKMGAAMGAVAGIAATLVTKGIDMISSSIGDAVKRVDTLNNSGRVFANMGFTAADTGKAMDSLVASIKGLPTPLDAAVRNMQLIASSTGDIGKSQKIFSSLNNAIIGFGGNAEMVNNTVVQLSQAFSNGKVDGQTWMSMMNSGMGPALTALAKKMGITTGALKDGLSSGKISVKQFQDSLIEMNEKGGGGLASFSDIAKDATKGIGTGMENAKTAVTRGVAAILTAIGTEKISGAITKIGESFEWLLKITGDVITLLFTGDYNGKMFGGALSEDSFIVGQLLAIRDAAKIVYDSVKLLFTGDFKKGMFAGLLDEDSLLVGSILSVRDALNDVYDTGKLLFSGDFSKDMFGGAFNEDSPLVNGLLSLREHFISLWNVIEAQLAPAWKDLTAAFESLKVSLAPFMPQLKQFAQIVGVVIVGGLVLFITTLALVTAATIRIIGWVAQLIAWIVNFGIAVNNAKNSANDALVGMIEGFGNFYRGATKWLNSLLMELVVLPFRILTAMGNLGGLLFNAGVDLVKGLLNGIASMDNAIKNKLKDMANGAVKAFKGILGINSPSKVFMGFGENITQGLVNGITAGMGDVRSAVNGMSGATLTPVVSMPNTSALENMAIDNNQSVTVVHKVDGLVVARSTSDMREIFSQGIELVNQQRRAKGQVQI
jgi:tape measure domain-containing protein